MKFSGIVKTVVFLVVFAKGITAQEDVCKPKFAHLALGSFYSHVGTAECPTAETPACVGLARATVVFETSGECPNSVVKLVDSKGGQPKSLATERKHFKFKDEVLELEYESYVHTVALKDVPIDVAHTFTVIGASDNEAETSGAAQNFSIPKPLPDDTITEVVLLGRFDGGAQSKDILFHAKSQPASATLILGGINPLSETLRPSESALSHRPVLYASGSEDEPTNYAFSKRRFPSAHDGHYFSANIGKGHFVVFSLRHYLTASEDTRKTMLEWLKKDLAEADVATVRATRPWIILVSGDPFYCSGDAIPCQRPSESFNDVEQVLSQHGVDIVLAGGVPHYERTVSVFEGHVAPFDVVPGHETDDTIDQIANPTAPIYVVVGNSGIEDIKEPTTPPLDDYSIFAEAEPGYAVLSLESTTHLKVSFRNVKNEEKDAFYLLKGVQGESTEKSWQKSLFLFVLFLLIVIAIAGAFAFWYFRRRDLLRKKEYFLYLSLIHI
eukprot:TRINITY_DN2211_c0_g1_i3.p1 TRINITY_DN2211_c0_g1~~TRINITY_DN2211_c0_g1_i3.p1  ORF type:complete len:497 (+),score=108.67 TRINITY_DN2211_c0_g1_i3:106-1596(+)